MQKAFIILLSITLFTNLSFSQENPSKTKQRVFVLTDISNEPDDEESMVRFLVYANNYDIEGLVATTSTWLKDKTREDLIRRQIEAYGTVRNNLIIHEKGFPTQEQLLVVTTTGQTTYGMKAVGEGKATGGSKLLLQAADKQDDRPLWVSVWGGANTLAQALSDARRGRSEADMKKLISKLRVYSISDQDDAGLWIRNEFPELFYIVSPSTQEWKEYWRATWTGISGDRHYKNGPQYKYHLVQNPWLEENIINNHGALGKLYPKFAYIMEGDTPSFMGLIDNGLGWAESPAYGGWGGRYVLYQASGETRKIWTNNQDSRDSVYFDDRNYQITDQATIWRWREHFQHDFAARMDWCVADSYKKANHPPTITLNSDNSKSVINIKAKPNEVIQLSAKGTSDPDNNKTKSTWFVYPEAGTYVGKVNLSANIGENITVTIPNVKENATIHVILQVEDNGVPALTTYRRVVINVEK
jgi:Protein of unknown function (DUF1593)